MFFQVTNCFAFEITVHNNFFFNTIHRLSLFPVSEKSKFVCMEWVFANMQSNSGVNYFFTIKDSKFFFTFICNNFPSSSMRKLFSKTTAHPPPAPLNLKKMRKTNVDNGVSDTHRVWLWICQSAHLPR